MLQWENYASFDNHMKHKCILWVESGIFDVEPLKS